MADSEFAELIAYAQPVIWVRMNEAAPPAVEMHRGDALTTLGSPVFDSSPAVGVTFDGVDDGLFLGDDAVESIPTGMLNDSGNFTVEALVRADNVASEGVTYIARWGWYGFEWTTYRFSGTNPSGYLTFKFYDEFGATYTVEWYDANLFPDSYHQHFAVTYDGANLKLFVDGTLRGSEPVSAAPHFGNSGTSTDGLGIAVNGPFSNGFWKGSISEFAIYDYALNDLEVYEHAMSDKVGGSTEDVADILLPWGDPPLPAASSFHIALGTPAVSPGHEYDIWSSREAAVTLRVLEEPTVDELYFWAMQVNWYDEEFNLMGGGHVGLQFHPDFVSSGKHAVNWGGYDADNNLLSGTESSLPSDTLNDNTRNFDWQVGKAYRLKVFSIGDDFWRATINGFVIRDLYVPGATFMVPEYLWSEVFADCDDPSVLVEWSFPTVTDAVETFPIETGTLNYQDPGCDNTNTYGDNGRVYQQTNTTRVNPTNDIVTFDPSAPFDAGEGATTISIETASFSNLTQDPQALGSYTDDTGREAGVRITTFGYLEMYTDPSDEPVSFTMMKRISPIMPTTITLNDRGQPQ